MVRIVKEVYERYGFEPLETPALENVETLVGKYGEEGNRLIFKILRRGEHEATGDVDFALRYDLTVPLARVVAQYQHELPKFFKRYQIQPVWRADRPARGRFREFYQCDIDAIGSTSPLVEVEIMSAAGTVLTKLGFDDFEMRLNHRVLLGALLGAAGVTPAQQGDALTALDKLDKIGLGGVLADLEARGIPEHARQWCLEFFQSTGREAFLKQAAAGSSLGANEEILQSAHQQLQADDSGRAAVEGLRAILSLAQQTSVGNRIRIDPSLARGLSYYTGAIVEIVVPDLAGALGGGGRYDTLVGMFLGRNVPACGFSLGLERILVVMAERGMFPGTVSSGGADVMVTLWSEDSRSDALTLATRASGRWPPGGGLPGCRQAGQTAQVRVHSRCAVCRDCRGRRAGTGAGLPEGLANGRARACTSRSGGDCRPRWLDSQSVVPTPTPNHPRPAALWQNNSAISDERIPAESSVRRMSAPT